MGLAAVLLCAVALINGGPIIYPDSLAYLIDADKLTHLRAPWAVRPVFYGLAVWPFYWGGQFALALFLQALVVAHVIYLTLRASGARPRPLPYLLLIVALVMLTPVSWHVSHILPDMFVAVMLLSLYLLGFCWAGLGRVETWYVFLLAAASASFHLTAIPVGAAVFALTALLWLSGARHRVRPLLVLGPLLLALAGSLAFSYAVFQRLTLTPNSPPHFLARIVADGPGREFLRRTCPQSGFELCDYLDRLPATEDEFLWTLLPNVPYADGKRIKAEAGAVIKGTIAMFPAQVAEHMLTNTARQLVTFRSETQFGPAEWAGFRRQDTPVSRALADTLQARGVFERPALDGVNAVHAGIALASLAVALVLLFRSIAARLFRPAALIGTVLIGLLANAFASGAFGGVFGRYEGRVIWLLPLAALTAALVLARAAARRRTRTGKPSRTSDFKSAASTNSARRA
jgi:hypothetical protein